MVKQKIKDLIFYIRIKIQCGAVDIPFKKTLPLDTRLVHGMDRRGRLTVTTHAVGFKDLDIRSVKWR